MYLNGGECGCSDSCNCDVMAQDSQGLGFAPIIAAAAAGSGPLAPIVMAVSLIGSMIPIALSQIGKGRREADIITPVQNQIGQRLAEINRAIDYSSILALQDFYMEVQDLGKQLEAFVSDPRFTDGRASHQALDTIMPLIDGTNADGQIVRPDGGTLGSIVRAIQKLGGNIQSAIPTQGAGMGPTLQTQLPGLAFLPQSGFLPPTSPLSPIRSAGVQTVGGTSNLLPYLFLGGAAALFLGSRRRGRA